MEQGAGMKQVGKCLGYHTCRQVELYQLSASGRIGSRVGNSQKDETALGPLRCLGRLTDICKVDKEIVIAVGWWSKVELKEEFG